MKNKKLIIIFLSSLIAFSAFAKDSEGNNSIFEELFEPRPGLLINASMTKPLVGKASDELSYGMGLSLEFVQAYFSARIGLDLHTYSWDIIDKTYYFPAEFGINLNLPVNFGYWVTLESYIGAAGNICLWNNVPTYGFSWNGGIHILVGYYGINVFYKHEYFYPIREKDSSINFGSLGIGFSVFLDQRGF
ncbi:MAG: hypothetical protein K6A89_10910 [Treponema sp.]|nr:hypothetical protein [Treponema sp.]